MARQGGARRPGGRRRSRSSAASGRSRSRRLAARGIKPLTLGRAARRARARLRRGRSPPARRSARRSRGSPATAPTSWCSTARSATPPTPRTSRPSRRSGSSQMYIAEQAHGRGADGPAGARQDRVRRRPSARSSRRADDQSAWARSAARTCACAARTPASRSARTGRRRWRSKTSRCSARCTARPCCTRPTATPRCKLVTTMCDLPGISYLRTTREATPVALRRRRGVPGRRVEDAARRSGDDAVTLVGAGRHACTSASRPPTRSRPRASPRA